jgi:hypothetical protein
MLYGSIYEMIKLQKWRLGVERSGSGKVRDVGPDGNALDLGYARFLIVRLFYYFFFFFLVVQGLNSETW